jgi:hypothetical protein
MDILGREPKCQARPWTNWRYWQGAPCDYGSEGSLPLMKGSRSTEIFNLRASWRLAIRVWKRRVRGSLDRPCAAGGLSTGKIIACALWVVSIG